jgi:hypothetical protein
MDQQTATALANEARRQAAKQSIADLQGRIENASSLLAIISSTVTDAQRQLATKQTELFSLEAGAGPGVSDDWGNREAFVSAYIAKCQAAGLITADMLSAFQALVNGPAAE